MTAEQNRWERLRDQAQAHLPNDFAWQVVRQAQDSNKPNRREYILIAITAAFCLASVAAANWYFGDRVQEKNLTQWGVAESQIRALRTSI
jgi:hypothetical protein